MKQLGISFICLSLISLSAIGQSSLNDLNVIFKHDFESNTLGDYLHDEWKSDWLSPDWNNRLAETDIVRNNSDTENPTKALQINFPAYSLGSNEGGTQWYTTINKKDELYVSYDIYFMPGFKFQLGGKLPSVQGGNVNAGIKPTGYDGFTGGLMFKEDGKITFYIYYPDSQSDEYGDSFPWGTSYSSNKPFSPSSVVYEYSNGNTSYCVPGQWHNLTYRMVLNTIKSGGGGNYDGILEAYFDGKLVTQLSHFLFRHTADIGIDCMRIYSFFGGNTDDWRNPIAEWLKIDNVILYTFKDNVNVPRGNVLSATNRTINYWRMFSTLYTDPPNAPTLLSVGSRSKSSINLKWTDNSNNEQGFRIYRATSSTGSFTEVGSVIANATTFSDNSLQPNTAYYYRVSAYNNAGNSAYTPVLSTSTLALQIPLAPTGLIASHIDYTLATVLWTDNANNESGFELERSGPNDNSIKNTIYLPANTVSHSDNGLVMNGTYQYRIRAKNDDGTSDWSNTIEIITPLMLPPVAPTKLKSTKFTDKSISVSWDDNSSNEEAFIITRSLAVNPALNASIKISANATAYTDTCLASSTTYQYTIKAVNLGGSSSLSNKNIATTLSKAELKRVKDGLVAYYNFGYNTDYIVYDQSGYGESVDLHVLNRSAVRWNEDNTLDILSNTALVSITPATKIIQALKRSNELTFECWIKPVEPDFYGGSRIVSLASNDDDVGFLLDQSLSGDLSNQSLTFSSRMQTESTNSAGYPEFIPNLTQRYINLQHLVFVRDSLGREAMYLNGVKSSEGFRPSDLGIWKDNYYLRLGNESDMNHSWKGSFYSVAIYNKALPNEGILTNYTAGPCDSINKIEIDYLIEVSPNPVSDKATLKITPTEISDIVPQTLIGIKDIYGKTLYQETVFNPNSQFTKTLDFSNYPAGIYFIQVISGKRQKSAKVIVQK